MGGRPLSSKGTATSHPSKPFRLSETVRARGLLTPEEVAQALGIRRKVVFGLPIPRQEITPKSIRYRVDEVEAFVERTTRPQALGFLFHASHHMDRQALTPANVARLLRMRRTSAVRIMSPHKRISVRDLERLVLATSAVPSGE